MKVQRKRLLADNKVSPWQTSLPPVLAQLPLFVLSSVTFYNMCQSPTPLDAESFLTLTSLSHPDPTSVLPIAVGIITFANIESSGWFRTEGEIERERKVAQWTKERQAGGETVVKPRAIIQGVLRLASVGRIVWAATLPGVRVIDQHTAPLP
jgi:inner membrane protein COX18